MKTALVCGAGGFISIAEKFDELDVWLGNKKKVGVVRDTNVTNDGELVKSIAKRKRCVIV